MMLYRFRGMIANVDTRELLVHGGIAFLVRILGALAAFSATFFIARQLGAEESGYYFLTYSIVAVLAALSRGGLDNTVVRFIAADTKQALAVYNKSILFGSALSVSIAIFFYLLADYLANNVLSKPALAPVFRSISLGIPGLALLTLGANALQGLRLVSWSIFVLNIAINCCLVGGAYYFKIFQAQQLALVFSVGSILIAISGGVLFYWKVPRSEKLGISWSIIFTSCLPLWLVVVMGQLVQWSGQFFAGAYLSPDLVAQLAVAQRTAMLTSFVLIAINLVVAPRFSALYKTGAMGELSSLAKKSVVLTSVIAFPILIVMLFFPTLFMGLFGVEFEQGASLLRILVIGQFVNVITGSVGFLLIMTGHERDLRSITLVSGTTALILAWVMTANFGVFGAAIGTAIAVATQNLLAVYFVKKRLGFNTLAVWR
ncbi:Uncharacterised protein [Zhongshania aliphaticivorans]|uniref:Uncharacterized protein n=2 Tax=Zhongshania aliphaticivorans TaxID=1470434 RepID=A0A5S9PN97_9GAMM|nr:Uncharacterised protein [Zhongshania aliphaticivorans]CAA0105897.1 Uncharacterised protein [Zhongshania aliphaticivorans]